MQAHYNSSLEKNIQGYLVIDTNILSACSSDPDFLNVFLKISQHASIVIDPVVKIEFLRGAYLESLYEDRKKFLKYEIFHEMMDHHQLHKLVYDKSLDIARIYAHHNKGNLPLGDLLITARLAVYPSQLILATMDREDFDTVLFGRIGVAAFERIIQGKQGKKEILDIVQFLRFDHQKFNTCLKSLP